MTDDEVPAEIWHRMSEWLDGVDAALDRIDALATEHCSGPEARQIAVTVDGVRSTTSHARSVIGGSRPLGERPPSSWLGLGECRRDFAVAVNPLLLERSTFSDDLVDLINEELQDSPVKHSVLLMIGDVAGTFFVFLCRPIWQQNADLEPEYMKR